MSLKLTKGSPGTYIAPNKPAVYYLASPYSSNSAYVREERYLKALFAGAELIEKGFCLIEPIGMSHHTSKVGGTPTGYDYWKTRDRAFIDHSDGVIVLMIDGWFESVGVTDEIHYAFEQGKEVYMYITNLKGHNEFMQLDRDSYIQAQLERQVTPSTQ